MQHLGTVAVIASGIAGLFGSAALAADPGALLFQGACATCHAAGSPRVLSGQKLLSQTGAITGNDPTHAVRLILQGHFPPPEQRGAWMPAYADMLSDAQITALLAWLRQTAGAPPWNDLMQRVRALRGSATGGGR